MKSKKSLIKIIFINALLFASFVLSIEFFLHLASFVKHSTFLKPKTRKIIDGEPIPTKWDFVFHPGVSHAHQIKEFIKNPNTRDLKFNNLSSFEVFGRNEVLNPPVKVLILGGSTSDPLGTQFSGLKGTWVHHLFTNLNLSTDLNYQVTNAGNGGATSSNELTRLVTEIHRNNFDVVISYNGINEIYFQTNKFLRKPDNVLSSNILLQSMEDFGVIKATDGRLFISNPLKYAVYTSKTYLHLMNIKRKIINKYIFESNKDIELAEETKQNLSYAAKVWAKNLTLMDAISRSQGAKYFAILQPTLGLNKNYCSGDKPCLLKKDDKVYQSRITKMRFLYEKMRISCSERPYCIDLSSNEEIISTDSLYTDISHPNSEGNRKIAEAIITKIGEDISH